MSYRVGDYAAMIKDDVRVQAYLAAMHHTIKPGSVVVELGTGIGFFAVMACRMGARRVYAIEPNNAIQVARELAVANGCAEQIEFIQNISTKIELPEKADVIVSDMRGSLPWYNHHIPALVDARQRLLVEGGKLICQRDGLHVAVVESPELYSNHLQLPEANLHDFNWQAARRILTNSRGKGRVKLEQILLPAQQCATLDYAEITDADFSSELNWIAERSGLAHGLLVWFDAELAGGVKFSNAPTESELVYGNTFFPFTEPISIAAGDAVSVEFSANLVANDYIWRWNTVVSNQVQVKNSFKQSTFWSEILSLQQFRQAAANHLPTLNEEGQLVEFVIKQMNGQLSVGEIADQVLLRFPSQFASRLQALTKVGALAQQYSR